MLLYWLFLISLGLSPKKVTEAYSFSEANRIFVIYKKQAFNNYVQIILFDIIAFPFYNYRDFIRGRFLWLSDLSK